MEESYKKNLEIYLDELENLIFSLGLDGNEKILEIYTSVILGENLENLIENEKILFDKIKELSDNGKNLTKIRELISELAKDNFSEIENFLTKNNFSFLDKKEIELIKNIVKEKRNGELSVNVFGDNGLGILEGISVNIKNGNLPLDFLQAILGLKIVSDVKIDIASNVANKASGENKKINLEYNVIFES